MKKINFYIVTLATSVLLLFSCKDVLDVQPKNILQADIIFSDESTVEAYLASLYWDLPMEDFRFGPQRGFNTSQSTGLFLAHLSDEALTTTSSSDIGDGTWLDYFKYNAVRNVNKFIANLPGSTLPEERKKELMGEAKFIRAYYYFGMVKRYGGVPLITVPQTYTGNNLEELRVPRNTEKEVYDFIAKELDEAASLMGTTKVPGRANRDVAYALKSRAMIYAASIAKYGTVQLNGLVGIPASEANKYWQAAYDATAQLLGKYSLYNKNSDKTQNFIDLFLDTNNPESIFARLYKIQIVAHSFDLFVLPYGVRAGGGYGGRISPTVELAEEYEFTDGSAGTLKLTDGSGNPIKYNNPVDLFANKDPRFAATFILPFSQFRGSTIDVQAGLIDGSKTITTGDYNNLYNPTTGTISSSGTIRIIGLNGIGGAGGERTQTGFYIRKSLNPNYDKSTVSTYTSETPFFDFRYAEILLNYAEAAVELGGAKVADAKTALNQIRARAGIKLLTDAEVTRDKVRHEREVELAFENHRYWDLRRWRIADQVLNNRNFKILMPYKDIADNKYIFKLTASPSTKNFLPKLYYEQIPAAEIVKNPKLIQNPLY